jgi:putative hydrolase
VLSAECRVKDINADVGGYLRDLASIQTDRQKSFGYKRAAAAILSLEHPLTALVDAHGVLPKISGIGPASARVIAEVLASGVSPTVERAVDESGKRRDVELARALRRHFLSRATVVQVLGDRRLKGPAREDYRGDLQMHSAWSDGSNSIEEIAAACIERGYSFAATTDHSYGLRIAGGMSMEDAAAQRVAIDAVNVELGGRFRLLHGVEANIDADGALDLTGEQAATFELVLAAPHSALRKAHDQTARLVNAIHHPAVRVLAHPRGRIAGTRPGIAADWPAVFAAAAERGVAVEIDGDPARQDLDYTLAALALDSGCLFALDSDAHTTGQLAYADIALAHARLAGIPSERIVNCWPLNRLLSWLAVT